MPVIDLIVFTMESTISSLWLTAPEKLASIACKVVLKKREGYFALILFCRVASMESSAVNWLTGSGKGGGSSAACELPTLSLPSAVGAVL